MPMSDAALSVLTKKDVPGLSALCRHAGWPGYDERELGLLLQNGRLFGYKNSKGTLLSCSGIFPYGSFASLGLVIVQKEFRGAGLGKKMVETCIVELNDTIPIMLVATEQGLPLYQKAGFQQISSIYKYVCDGFLPHTADSDIDIAPFQPKDFQALTKTDRAAFGTGRERLLQQLISGCLECTVAKNKDGSIVGYGLSRQTPDSLRIGPLIAPSRECAALLINELAYGKQGRIRIDISGEYRCIDPDLAAMGFVRDTESPLMVLRKSSFPKRNGHLVAVTSQGLG
ncbi:GNAT family N-acetyltransferase [Bacillus atrophaeus]|uniref:GNAT family N-acetyltransferase n=1 Tax=Bacillus atrophaeus TaxID=1452 RepID=UPI00227DAE23|nr:GNAT family N-acetyltransferase [Bacillus atrophaeus]MCY8520121.1 GNAT family N-acetyltransferase [Bacillus atrophaeus]MCY8526855.1 GNAT family N-acetyltransferase [Bacillus atrophaeus]